jgi:hypothetical protein
MAFDDSRLAGGALLHRTVNYSFRLLSVLCERSQYVVFYVRAGTINQPTVRECPYLCHRWHFTALMRFRLSMFWPRVPTETLVELPLLGFYKLSGSRWGRWRQEGIQLPVSWLASIPEKKNPRKLYNLICPRKICMEVLKWRSIMAEVRPAFGK